MTSFNIANIVHDWTDHKVQDLRYEPCRRTGYKAVQLSLLYSKGSRKIAIGLWKMPFTRISAEIEATNTQDLQVSHEYSSSVIRDT